MHILQPFCTQSDSGLVGGAHTTLPWVEGEVQPGPAATLFCITDQAGGNCGGDTSAAPPECLHCSRASALETLLVVPGLLMSSRQADGGEGGEKKRFNTSVVMKS